MKTLISIGLILLAISLSACSGTGFSSFGTSLLSSTTGLNVSSGQIDSLMSAGNKLASAARGLTEEQEYYLGRGVAAVVLSKYPQYKDANLSRYLTKVGYSVAVFSDRPETFGGYHFVVLDTQEVNALSGPGGYVFVTRGFLKHIPDEDALAAVLAHEVGHIVKGHGTAAISNANLTEALTIIGKEAASSSSNFAVSQLTSAFGDSITDITNSLLEKGYSRSQEYEADLYAAQLLDKSGYNPTAIVTMLQGLEKLEAANPSGGWFSTHPKAEKRVEEVKDEVELVDTSATPAGAKAQKTRTARYRSFVKVVG